MLYRFLLILQRNRAHWVEASFYLLVRKLNALASKKYMADWLTDWPPDRPTEVFNTLVKPALLGLGPWAITREHILILKAQFNKFTFIFLTSSKRPEEIMVCEGEFGMNSSIDIKASIFSYRSRSKIAFGVLWYAKRLGIKQLAFLLDCRREVSSKRASNPATRQERTTNYNENPQTSIFTNLA